MIERQMGRQTKKEEKCRGDLNRSFLIKRERERENNHKLTQTKLYKFHLQAHQKQTGIWCQFLSSRTEFRKFFNPKHRC